MIRSYKNLRAYNQTLKKESESGITAFGSLISKLGISGLGSGCVGIKYIGMISIFFLLSSLALKAQSLEEFQRMAVEQNPGLKAKYKEFEAALQKVPQVKSLQDPTFSFGYFISPVETRVGPQRARLSLSQMFPWFGTLKVQGHAAAIKADVIYQQLMDMQNKIQFQVSESYLPLAELQQLVDIQKANISLLKSWKALATSKFENGQISLSDALRIDISINELETERQILEDKRKPLSIALNRFLNRPDSTNIQTVYSNETEELPLIEANWSNHPRILELNKQIETKELENKAIQKLGLPKIGAGLDYVITGSRSDMNISENGKNAFMPTISMSLPIFRKKYSAAIKENEYKIESYHLSIQAVQNELIAGYENLKYEAEREIKLLTLYDTQIKELIKIQDLLITAFSNSGKDLDELLRIQMQLLNYQTKKINATTRLNTLVQNTDYLIASGSK